MNLRTLQVFHLFYHAVYISGGVHRVKLYEVLVTHTARER